jgi:Spy/CpxP family protein refolding chaperone
MSNTLNLKRARLRAVRAAAVAAALLAAAVAPARASSLVVGKVKRDSLRSLPAMVVLAPAAGWPSTLLQGINLSQAQRVRLDSIRSAYAPRIDFGGSTSTFGTAQPLSWGARLQLRMEQRNAIRSVLTPQQRVVFDANAQRIRDRIQLKVPPQPTGIHKYLRFGLG